MDFLGFLVIYVVREHVRERKIFCSRSRTIFRSPKLKKLLHDDRASYFSNRAQLHNFRGGRTTLYKNNKIYFFYI